MHLAEMINGGLAFGNSIVQDPESHVVRMDWCFAQSPVPVADSANEDEVRAACVAGGDLTPLNAALPPKADPLPGGGGTKSGPRKDANGNVYFRIGAGLPNPQALMGTEIFLGAR